MVRIDFHMNKKGVIVGSTVVESDTHTEIPLRVVGEEKDSPFPQHRSRARARSMGFGYVAMLAVAGCICLLLCVNYLHIRSDLQNRQASVDALETQLAKQKADNDVIQQKVDSAMDLTRIYRLATTQYGMVYPENGQVLEYHSTDKEFVTQNREIPKS